MRVVSKRLFIAVFLLTAATFIPQAQAQTKPITGEEYLRSVSIQSKDRSVQSPAEVGVQRVVDIAALPPRRQSTPAVTAGFAHQNPNSIFNSQSGLSSVHTTQFQTGAPAVSNSNLRYPYPAQTPPRVAPPAFPANSGFGGSRTFVNSNETSVDNGNQLFGSNATGANATIGTNPSYGTNSTNVVVYRAPTLRLGPVNVANPEVANQPLAFGGQTVGTNVLSPTQIAPQPIYPPVAPQTSPVQLQKLPPGNYQGAGLNGRPVTYVDGQPVRNLFRYIFP